MVKFRLQSPSKPTLLVGVQNFTIFSVLETARGVVFTARRGQNNCAAAHARSLEGTLVSSPSYSGVQRSGDAQGQLLDCMHPPKLSSTQECDKDRHLKYVKASVEKKV